jgi:hypothetical protein
LNELLIPFGIDRDTRQIIEPEDAARGRVCNCLCPGCEAPLLSRHPQRADKRIHFAHDSKHAEDKPVDDCPLSPSVAMAMMARYIGPSLVGKQITLIEHSLFLTHECCLSSQTATLVAPKLTTTIEGAQKSVSIGGTIYDLELTLSGKKYYVDIYYDGKHKKELPGPEFMKDVGGIMSLPAAAYLAMMHSAEFDTMRYRDSVEYFLLCYAAMDWEYHHLALVKVAEEQSKHECPPKTISPILSDTLNRNDLSRGSHLGLDKRVPGAATSPPLERSVSCFYCGQPMSTRALKTPALGHKCELCRKYNREQPHKYSSITKAYNHNANMADERGSVGASGIDKSSIGYKDIRG